MAAKAVRTAHHDPYPSAACHGCDQDWDEGMETLESVKEHVKTTGHAVSVTRAVQSLYERRT